MKPGLALLGLLLVGACSSTGGAVADAGAQVDGDGRADASKRDAGSKEAGTSDAGHHDAAHPDAGHAEAGAVDAGHPDAGDLGDGGDGGDGGATPGDGAALDGADADTNPCGTGTSASIPLQGTVQHVAAFTQAAIVAAIAAANSGDTVYFPAGTYEITSTITLKGAVLYHGEPGAILHNAAGTTTATATGANDLSIDGLTFDGGNLTLAGGAPNFSTNINVVHCTIENVLLSTNFGEMQGILIDHLASSHFDYNTFTNNGVMGESYALISYATNDSSFSHNTLTSTYQGFHFESADATGGNDLDVSCNTATGLLGLGIEFNKVVSTSTVLHNHLDAWRPGNANGLALSIVASGSGTVVEDNYVSGVGCSTCNIGIEAGGTDALFEGNTVIGFETNIAVACAPGTVIQGNTISGSTAWGPMIEDGGYCTGSTIGMNDIDGVEQTGYTFP